MPESSVIDVLFRARDADKVAKSAQMVGEGLQDLAQMGQEGAKGLDLVEEQAKKTDTALDELEKRPDNKKKTGATVDPKAKKEVTNLSLALDKMEREAKEAQRALEKVGDGKNTKGIKSATTNFLKMGLAMGGVVVGAQLVAGAFRGIKQQMADSIKAASVQEDANKALAVSFQTIGKFSQAAVQDIKDYASAIQQSTAFGDEAVIKTAALIQQLGGLSGKALKDTTTAALDMAVAMERNVDQVAILLGKAARGETGSLSEYGIIIDRTLPKSQQFEAALEAINTAFGGSAAARVRTYSGATAQLSNAMGDLREAIGEGVLPVLTKFANKATPLILKLVDAIRGLRGETEHSATELVRIMESQTAALRGVGGEMAQIIEAGRADIQREAIAQLRLEIQKGDLESVLETLEELDKTMVSSTVKGERTFAAFMEAMRAEAIRGIQLRVGVDTAKARAGLKGAIQALQGEADLDLLIQGTPDFREAMDQLRGISTEAERLENIRAKINFTDLQAMQERLEKAEELAEQLAAQLATLKIGADKSKLKEDLEAAKTEIAAAEAALDEFNAKLEKDVGAGAVTFSLVGPPVAVLAEAALDVQRFLDQEANLSAAFSLRVEDAKTLDELKAVLKQGEAQFQKLKTAAADTGPTREAALSFGLALEKAQALVEIRSKLLKKPDLSDEVDLIRALQDSGGGTTTAVDIIDTEQLREDASAGEEALLKLKEAVDAITSSKDPAAIAQGFVILEAAVKGSEQGVLDLDAATVAYAKGASAQLEAAAKKLEPLQKAQLLQTQVEILIETEQLSQARIILNALELMAANFPSIKLKGDITALKASLEEAEELTTTATDKLGEHVQEAATNILESGFGGAFDAMAEAARGASVKTEDIIGGLVDGILAEFKRLLASGLAKAILKLFGGGAGGVLGSLVGGLFSKGSLVSEGAETVKPTAQGGPPSASVASPRLSTTMIAQQAATLRAISQIPIVLETAGSMGRLGTLLSGGGRPNVTAYIQAMDALSFEDWMSPGGQGRRGWDNLMASGGL